MAEDPLHDIIDSVRTRLQAELETQLRAVSERHQQSLAAARQRIEAEAEQRWAGRLEAARAEGEEHLHAALAAVRAEMEQHSTDEIARVRAEAQEAATAAASTVRREMEQALAAERQRTQLRIEDERRSAAEQIEQARAAFEGERNQWVAGPATTVDVQPSSFPASSLLQGLRAIDAATSVSDSLAAIARTAAAAAPRAALFIANDGHLDEWAVSGLPSLSAGSLNLTDPDSGIVVEALRKRAPVKSNGSACAVPLVLDGQPVGVLYGEADAGAATAAEWSDSLEAVARYGSNHLGYLTALRTAQARQWLASAGREPDASRQGSFGADQDEAVAAARRYARLVVSEIKLYHEGAVEAGRSRRDLLQRLGPEIDRARRLYDERVPASVPGRTDYFEQELVQTLAAGDRSLLG